MLNEYMIAAYAFLPLLVLGTIWVVSYLFEWIGKKIFHETIDVCDKKMCLPIIIFVEVIVTLFWLLYSGVFHISNPNIIMWLMIGIIIGVIVSMSGVYIQHMRDLKKKKQNSDNGE